MRQIIFRGKRVDNNEWVHGFYYTVSDPMHEDKRILHHRIHTGTSISEVINILPSTIGQYTGRTTKDKVKVFECDILQRADGQKGKIIYNEVFCTYDFVCFGKELNIPLCNALIDSTIIGNIHDNPELLNS